MQNYDLVISGGAKDPNLSCLANAAFSRGLKVKLVLVDQNNEPAITYDLKNDKLIVHGERVVTRAAFIRYDVFSYLTGGTQACLDKSQAWYSAALGWCLNEPNVRIFNRHLSLESANKVAMLNFAKRLGLRIPDTVVTNECSTIGNLGVPETLIAKPLVGGAYCQPLEMLLPTAIWRDGTSPHPAFVQEKLTYPEYRVYLIGDEVFVFEIRADDLDYRISPSTTLKLVNQQLLGAFVIQRLKTLAREIKATFCAFDLKTCGSVDDTRFLEINTAPMFVAFDAIVNGALSNAMLNYLMIS